MIEFLGFVFSLILAIKLTIFLLHLLLSKFGRNAGCGVKWVPDKDADFAVVAGASGQVGSEYAREFASMGYNLVLIARNADKINKLATELKEKYQLKEIKVLPVDFSHPSSVEKVKSTLSDLPSVAALVNCMGIVYPAKKFGEYPTGFNSDLLNVNVVAPVLLIEMVLPKMLAKKRGCIINYSSMAGRFQFPFFSTFSATKSFISTLSEILAVEYNSEGIIVQCVEPFFVQSYMTYMKPGFISITPATAVYSSMREVGLAPTTHGFWKHKLVALLLQCTAFILGTRITSKIIGCLLYKFVAKSGAPSATDQTSNAKTSKPDGSSKTPATAATNSNKSETSTSDKTETSTGTKPKSNMATKPESNMATKPESNMATKPEASMASKPEASMASKPEASTASKPEASTANKTDASVSDKPKLPFSSNLPPGPFSATGASLSSSSSGQASDKK